MKSIKTNPNSAKGPDKGKIVNKLYCILLTTLEYRVVLIIFFFQKKTDMKFITLVSNLKEISPSVFSWKKEYIKNYDAILLSKYDSAEKRYKIMLTVYVLKNGVGRYNIFFFNFYTKLAKSSFLCRFRVESVNVFVLARFDLSTFSSSTNHLAHAQTLSRMSSWSARMNIARVDIEILLDTKKSNSNVFPSF
jgi:hypothetical protein